jgi:transposase
VKHLLGKIARRIAPRTLANLQRLSGLNEEFDQGPARFVNYERELRALRREIDELRRDNRRVAELYDVVFEWAHQNAAERGVAPVVDAAATTDRVGRLFASHPERPQTH